MFSLLVSVTDLVFIPAQKQLDIWLIFHLKQWNERFSLKISKINILPTRKTLFSPLAFNLCPPVFENHLTNVPSTLQLYHEFHAMRFATLSNRTWIILWEILEQLQNFVEL